MRSVVTKIPVHDAKGALTWPRHGSSDQPDVAVKANDHERLVAMLVHVLPRSSFSDRCGHLRDVRCWSAPVRRIPATFGLCGETQPERARIDDLPCP